MLEELTNKVRDLVDAKSALGFDLAFDLGQTGYIFVGGRSAPIAVSNDRVAANTTIIVSPEDLQLFFDGSLQAVPAYMSGRLKVEGDIGNALKLGNIFS